MVRIADLTQDQEFLLDHLDCTGVICREGQCPLKTEGGQCLTTYTARLVNRQLEIDWQKVMELYGKKE